MNEYLYTVLFIATVIGALTSIPGVVLVIVVAVCEDVRWWFALPIPLAIGILSLAWGLVYG